jgi:hypothetical protein
VPVVFLIAIAVVLVGIFFAATGRGGELAYEHADHAPLDLGPVSAADIALLRPPTAMWGYNMQVTDAALDQIARAMRERDVTIAYLQDQLAGHERSGSYPDYSEYAEPRGAHARQAGEALDPPGILLTPGPPTIPDPVELPTSPGAPKYPDTLDALEPPEPPEPGTAVGTAPEPPTAESPAAESPAPEPPTAESAAPGPPAPEPPAPEPPAPEPPAAATAPAPGPPQTDMVLKASGPKPERHEPTQPSPILPDPESADDATQPSAVLGEGKEPSEEPGGEPSEGPSQEPGGESGEITQPSAPVARDDVHVPGPQGAFDTHGWWAEQQEAARQEQARRQAAGEQDDESVAAAEEQGW